MDGIVGGTSGLSPDSADWEMSVAHRFEFVDRLSADGDGDSLVDVLVIGSSVNESGSRSIFLENPAG